jgi:hypothetical protein
MRRLSSPINRWQHPAESHEGGSFLNEPGYRHRNSYPGQINRLRQRDPPTINLSPAHPR